MPRVFVKACQRCAALRNPGVAGPPDPPRRGTVCPPADGPGPQSPMVDGGRPPPCLPLTPSTTPYRDCQPPTVRCLLSRRSALLGNETPQRTRRLLPWLLVGARQNDGSSNLASCHCAQLDQQCYVCDLPPNQLFQALSVLCHIYVLQPSFHQRHSLYPCTPIPLKATLKTWFQKPARSFGMG